MGGGEGEAGGGGRGTKKKNISKKHPLLLVASCLMSVGRVVLGLVLCGGNCLEVNSVVSDVLSDINDKYSYI